MLTTQIAQFEQTLAFHCAPALAGIKPADLISWPGSPQQVGTLLEIFSRRLSRAQIRLRLLCACGRRCLILVYRQEQLRAQLEGEEVCRLLRRDGYPVGQGMDALLEHLAQRIRHSGDFPHEVGLFLGYPPADVEGFRAHQGRNFKYCGLWKVYSDVDGAQRRFLQYHRCRQALCRRVEAGTELGQLFQKQLRARA